MTSRFHQRFSAPVRFLILTVLVLPQLILAQLPTTELHSVQPPVVPAGKATVVSVTGSNLDELVELQFSHPKVTAKRLFLPKSEFRTQPVPDGNKFEVTVPGDVPAGAIEVRARGYFGFTQARPLVVASSGTQIFADSAGAAHHKISSAPELPRDAHAHGTCDANQVDWWRIAVKKGERLLVHCQAERIGSQADASLKLVDGRGHELESNRDFVGRDPMLDFTAPADGNYWVGVHDGLYNGGANFSYLLEVSAKPWIDAVFPPAGTQGQPLQATLFGRNLPGGSAGEGLKLHGKSIETLSVSIEVPTNLPAPRFSPAEPSRAALPGFPFQHSGSNTVKVGTASLPVLPVRNDAEIPPFVPPKEIAAIFEEDGDSDTFRMVAKKGVTYWVEVTGDRIAGQIDPFLHVEKVTKNNDGTEVFSTVRESDDENGRGGGTFRDGTRDSTLSFAADQDGEYRITVGNHFALGGVNKTYRLAIREACPGFELIAVAERPYNEQRQAYPASPLLRKGGTFPLRILARRLDGYDGPITIVAEGLPAGVTAPAVTLSAKEHVTRFVLAASPDAAPWSGSIQLKAKAKVGEKEEVKSVRIGALTFGVGDYNTARLRSRLELNAAVAVSEHETTPARIEAGNDRKFSVMIGEKLEIPVKILSEQERKGNLTITPVGLRGLTRPPTINIAEKAKEGKLTLNFVKQNNVFSPEPGTWTFVLKGTGTTRYKRNPKAAERAAAEQKHIEELAKKAAEAASTAKAEAEAKKKVNEQAQKNLAAASPESKVQLEQAAAAAKTAFEGAQQKASEAEAKRAAAEKEKAAAVQRANNTKKAATAKDTKFAAWSLPVTVEVKPAPEKK